MKITFPNQFQSNHPQLVVSSTKHVYNSTSPVSQFTGDRSRSRSSYWLPGLMHIYSFTSHTDKPAWHRLSSQVYFNTPWAETTARHIKIGQQTPPTKSTYAYDPLGHVHRPFILLTDLRLEFFRSIPKQTVPGQTNKPVTKTPRKLQTPLATSVESIVDGKIYTSINSSHPYDP